jgi:hypothetical protein
MQMLNTNMDIFYLPNTSEAVCITTNGITDKYGNAVMGKGIALQAKNLFHCEKLLGSYLKQYGNRCFNLGQYKRDNEIFNLFSFPTKHHWKDISDITLICTSAEQIIQMCDKFNITKCYLPLVGCGAGGLNWEVTVEPWLSNILDDRFIIVNNRK